MKEEPPISEVESSQDLEPRKPLTADDIALMIAQAGKTLHISPEVLARHKGLTPLSQAPRAIVPPPQAYQPVVAPEATPAPIKIETKTKKGKPRKPRKARKPPSDKQVLNLAKRQAKDIQAALAPLEIGYTPTRFILTPFPYSDKGNEPYSICVNDFYIHLMGRFGVPFGPYVRRIVEDLVTRAVRQPDAEKSPRIPLPKSFNAYMREMGLNPTGGKKGTITSLKEQLRRFITTTVSFEKTDGKVLTGNNFFLIKQYCLWDFARSEDLVDSADPQFFLRLSDEFFHMIHGKADGPKGVVPVSREKIKRLGQNALAIDIYQWLTIKAHLGSCGLIRWPSLYQQFGSGYKDIKHFKPEFDKQLKRVKAVYPGISFATTVAGVLLNKSKSDVPALIPQASK